MRLNTEKITNESSLQDIKNEQSAIKIIGTQITDNNNIEALINNYLPNKKSEERIIGGVSYLAADSGIFLDNISLRDIEVESPVAFNPVPTGDMVEGQIAVPDNSDKVQLVEATLSIRGDYDKIKLFVNQLQTISLFNDIKSLSISKGEERRATNPDGSEVVANSSTLLAEIVVNFGYLPSSEVNNGRIANFKPQFDTNAVNVLKQYISQKTDSADYLTSKTEKGRPNPFLP